MTPINQILIPRNYAGNPEAESQSGDLGEAGSLAKEAQVGGVQGPPVPEGENNGAEVSRGIPDHNLSEVDGGWPAEAVVIPPPVAEFLRKLTSKLIDKGAL